MGDALKLGIIPKELLLEADRQGYNYSKDDYHLILSGFQRKVIIHSGGVFARKRVLYDPSSEYGGYGSGKPVLTWEVTDLTNWEKDYSEQISKYFITTPEVLLDFLDCY